MKRQREFWLKKGEYDWTKDNWNGPVYLLNFTIAPLDEEKYLRVREVNPAFDAAVEGLVTELKNQSCLSNGCGNGWHCGRCEALAAFEKALSNK